MSEMILQVACCDLEVPEAGHSVKEVTCLFQEGGEFILNKCHFIFNYRCFCGKKELQQARRKRTPSQLTDALCCIRRYHLNRGKPEY